MTVQEVINQLLRMPLDSKLLIPISSWDDWDEEYEESTCVWTDEDNVVYVS